MSIKTKARRYKEAAKYSEQQQQELIGHLMSGTQPQRRLFLGKLDNFKDKEERRIHQKALKAYLKGKLIYFDGKRKQEIIFFKFNKETRKKDIPVQTGVFQDVPQGHIVPQVYLFN